MKFVNNINRNSSLKSGFTLIELLVVIAVLGVLAGAVLIAIDPLEQLARGRDSGRSSAVTQMGRSLEAYYAANSAYPTAATWATDMQTSGEIKAIPKNPDYSKVSVTGCPTGTTAAAANNYYCYVLNATNTEALVFAKAEADQNNGKCTGAEVAWHVFSTADGRAGIVCTANASTAPTVGTQTFQ